MNPKNRTMIIVVGAIVLVLGLAGLAVLLTGGDDEAAGVLAPGESGPAPVEVEENRPVEVTGAPLPQLDSALAVDPAVGTTMPTIAGQTFEGAPITLGGATDGTTMLVYLAHWCPHCNDEIPELIELNQRGGFPDDMTVIGVSTGVDAAAPNYPPSEWLDDKGWPWQAMADSVDSTAFVNSGGSGFPYMVILDADGTVLARASGEKTADELEVWISEALDSATA